jgi:peptidyl-dipeptidase A
MKKIVIMITSFLVLSCLWSCTSKRERMEKRLKNFLIEYDERVIPLYKESAIASWNANITGTEADLAKSEKASYALERFYTYKNAFLEFKAIKESGLVRDSLLSRQLDLIYDLYLGGQVDTNLIALRLKMETEINKKYLNFRTKINDKELTDNQVESILKNSINSNELKAAWEASKELGPVVADDIIQLVKQRNLIAQKLGFGNYHEMSLKLSGIDPKEVNTIFDELDNLTREGFIKLKGEIDNYYSKRYHLKVSELRPWHYQNRYFQESPDIYPVDIDGYYKNQDPVKLAAAFYNGIGLNVNAILAKSDLYEKSGKNQHAFSTDIDREGDVRTLDNIKPDSYWMNTILHELGHGVYSYYNDRNLPFTLRDAAHPFTTEAIAEMFGRFAKDPGWMVKMGVINEEESKKINDNLYKSSRLQLMVFSRWAQVMYRFEKSMYENPGQDLNKLWWDLVEKYQMISGQEGRNMPDWATKIHIALYPCYYHNYLLGEVLASQLYYYLTSHVTNNSSFVGEKTVGFWLESKVFRPGAKYYWNDMIEKATGEKLTAKYFAKQYVQ